MLSHSPAAIAIALAFAFNVVAGFSDGGNLLAAATASRIIPPRTAFIVISLGALAGPLIVGTAVAATIGRGVVDYQVVGALPLCGGIAGALSAVLLAYAIRFPTSGSVALMGATVGSLLALHELNAIRWQVVEKVAISLFGSIVVGFAAGALVYAVLLALLRGVDYRTGMRVTRLQYGSVTLQAFGYGANDAEKMMGLMVAATMVGKPTAHFGVPLWIVVVAVTAFALGMAIGGVRIARTIGGRLFRIRPLHALAFQIASAGTVLTASALGGPLSSTETTASAILGVGTVANPRALRWQVAREMILAWLLTLPVGMACGWTATLIFKITHLVS